LWNGSAITINEEMLRNSTENLLVVPLDGEQIKEAIAEGDFWSLLKCAHRRALAV